MYTGDVNSNVERYPVFVFMPQSLARVIRSKGMDVTNTYNNLVELEKIVSYSDMSEYVNINAALHQTFPSLGKINNILKSKVTPLEFSQNKNNDNLYVGGYQAKDIFDDKESAIIFDKYINYHDHPEEAKPTNLSVFDDESKDSSSDSLEITQSYELVKGKDAKSIIVIFKPSFKKSLKVRNELNNFILACLGELRELLSNKENLTRYDLFSKITQL